MNIQVKPEIGSNSLFKDLSSPSQNEADGTVILFGNKVTDARFERKHSARMRLKYGLSISGIAHAIAIFVMQQKHMSDKSRLVLKALAKGRSCEQILAANRTLTSHDIFRALSESPTGFWDRKTAPKTEPGSA